MASAGSFIHFFVPQSESCLNKWKQIKQAINLSLLSLLSLSLVRIPRLAAAAVAACAACHVASQTFYFFFKPKHI
jgi:hypothetical protein